jgi:hypothetical protein
LGNKKQDKKQNVNPDHADKTLLLKLRFNS